MSTQSCATCRFAQWAYTEHEKPRRKEDWALCSAPIDVSAVRLPDSVQVVPNLQSYLERSRHGVGPHCGEKCPCYEAAEPLPTRSQMAKELEAAGWQWQRAFQVGWKRPAGGWECLSTVAAWQKMKKEEGHG